MDPSPPSAGTHRRLVRPGWIVAVVVLVVVAWAAVVTVDLLRADRHLRAGMAAAEQARQSLDAQSLEAGTAIPPLRVAGDEFKAAHHEVSGPWFALVRYVPIIGTQIRSVDDLSGAAGTVASAGSQALVSVHQLFGEPRATPAERATIVERLSGTLAALSVPLAHLHFGPSHGLIGWLAAKRTTFVEDVGEIQTGVDKAAGATAALADVLRGPQTYLLAATNNAEMRAGSGMMLQAGTIKISGGRFSLGHFAPTGSLVDTHTRLKATGDLEARWGFEDPTVDFRELLFSPQFPANASLAAQMWQERTGQRVDGVVTIDVGALQDLLGATGPVTVGTTTYTQSNVVNELLIGQYAGIGDESSVNAARHQQQAALAAAVFAVIDNGSTPLTTLANAFDQAVDGRHLMVWAADPRIEADWAAAGADGSIGGNDMLLSLLNQGANKLDPYQHVSSALSATVDGSGTKVTAQVTVNNQTPADLKGYAAGGGPGIPPARQYTGTVSLDLPKAASHVTATGGRIVAIGPDGGSQVVAVAVAIPRGRSKTVTFSFVVAGSDGSLDVMPSARIPATTWTTAVAGQPKTTFSDDFAHTVRL